MPAAYSPPPMPPGVLAGYAVVLGLATLAVGLIGRRRLALPVWASVSIAAALRTGFAALTSDYTPRDVIVYFHATAVDVLAGRDPLGGRHPLPPHEWNFLTLMPYIHAAELKTGLPWRYAVKIAPIVADCLVVWLISVIARQAAVPAPRSVALAYAVNPLSLLVVALHGQVEPVALCFALGGVALAQRRRWAGAGLLLGAAVAAKTWPVIIAVAVLVAVLRPPLRRRLRAAATIVAAGAVVPLACVGTGMAFLDTRVGATVHAAANYRSFIELWTWSGLLVNTGLPNAAGYSSQLDRPATIVLAVGVAATLYAFRGRSLPVLVTATLAATIVFISGFGPQYLLWPLPALFMVGARWREAYVVVASLWASLFYAPQLFATPAAEQGYLAGLSWLVVAVLGAVLVGLWRAGDPDADPGDAGSGWPGSSSASRPRTRASMSSTIRRTLSRSWPAGSSTGQST